MKIKFTEAPPGRDYKAGDVAEFNGSVPEGYARKYVARGWAVEVKDEPKPEPKKAEAPKAEAPKQDKPQVFSKPR